MLTVEIPQYAAGVTSGARITDAALETIARALTTMLRGY